MVFALMRLHRSAVEVFDQRRVVCGLLVDDEHESSSKNCLWNTAELPNTEYT